MNILGINYLEWEKRIKDLENLNDIIEEKVRNEKWNIDTVLINQMILEKSILLIWF